MVHIRLVPAPYRSQRVEQSIRRIFDMETLQCGLRRERRRVVASRAGVSVTGIDCCLMRAGSAA